ncbi:hypothetical protein A1L58_04665 [Shewanella baltica]|uniref:hypothetical protein n=1 Tax=Shewanella TaxID=22 RepID=UPI0007B4C9AD|nr:hypothetical protein [Shewanella baltica]KZK66710.1 hypothetical protein A1L58_04665 [Shewanella baltica]
MSSINLMVFRVEVDMFNSEFETILITLIVAAVGIYFTAYIKENAKFRMLEEKQDKILEHQSDLVTQTEKIKSEFDLVKLALQHQSWIDEQRWQFRKDLFLELIEILLEAREHALHIEELVTDAQKCARSLTSGDERPSDEAESLAKDIMEEAYAKSEEIIGNKLIKLSERLKSLLNKKGVLFLSDEAIRSISLFINSHQVWREEELKEFASKMQRGELSFDDQPAVSYDEYLFHYISAATRSYRNIINIAKSDLQI